MRYIMKFGMFMQIRKVLILEEKQVEKITKSEILDN